MNDNQTIRRKTIGSPIRAGNQSESPVQSQQVPADMTMQRRKSVYVPGSKASDPTELENRIKISNWKNDIEGCRVQEQKWKDKIGQEAQTIREKVKEFFIPVNGEFMQIANCRKYMEHEQDLNKVIYWLNHAFWDATQEQIGKDLEELLQIDQQTELSADTGIEIARQGQLTSLLRQLQVETCEVQY